MKRRNMIIIISIISFITIVIGVSYSYFVYNKNVADISLNTGSISIDLANVNGNLTLSNLISKNDYDGSHSSDYIDFTVNASVDTDMIYYEVYIMPKENSTLNTNYLKVYLTDQNDVQINGISIYDNLNDSQKTGGKRVYRTIVETNNDGTVRSYSKDFRLRLWLTDDYPDITSKLFDFDIYIYAYNVANGSMVIDDVSHNATNRNINATNLSVPANNKEGLAMYYKEITIQNTSAMDGTLRVLLNRKSGLSLTDLSYAIIVNGAIQNIGDVPITGEILSSAIMMNETVNIGVRLWPKTSYNGSKTTFVGEIVPEIGYLESTVASIENISGKYVNFNCDGNNCEVWRIVKIEDGRLVLTRQSNYEDASQRINSNRYNSSLSFNDNSLITSVSTDNKNVYLAKTVNISSGSGTQVDPYNLTNSIIREADKKVIAVITYKDDDVTLGTQNVYYGATNYISQTSGSPIFQYWEDSSENTYHLGDTVNFTSDINLTTINRIPAANIEYINNTLQCSTIQCALVKIGDIVYGESE